MAACEDTLALKAEINIKEGLIMLNNMYLYKVYAGKLGTHGIQETLNCLKTALRRPQSYFRALVSCYEVPLGG